MPQLRCQIDFEGREVGVFIKSPLDVEPTLVRIPFAVWKATAGTILRAEAEDELTAMLEAGLVAAPEQKIIVKGG